MTASQSRGRLRRAHWIAPIVAVAMLVSAGTGSVLAQGQESRPTAAVQAQASGPSDGSAGPNGLNSNVGALPFTGLDLLILAGLSMTLLGSGMALRRLSAPRV